MRKLLLFSLFALLASAMSWATTETWVKVTSTPESWDGDYLIVYEEGNIALNVTAGSKTATSEEATQSTVGVTISDGTISLDDAYSFTIKETATSGEYTITSKSGFQIGTSAKNKLYTGTTLKNSIKFDKNILKITSLNYNTGFYLQYNDQYKYFRYYSSNNLKPIALYKKQVNSDQVAAPTFSVKDGSKVGYGTEISVTSAEGTNLVVSYGDVKDENVGSNTKTITLPNEGETYTIKAYAVDPEDKKSDSETVTVTYTLYKVVPVPHIQYPDGSNAAYGWDITIYSDPGTNLVISYGDVKEEKVGTNSKTITLPTEKEATSSTYTISAYAVDDNGNQSETVTVTYNLYGKVSSIREFLNTKDTEKAKMFSKSVTVVYQNGRELYVKDDTGSLLIFGNTGLSNLKNGDVIEDCFAGLYAEYYGLPELTKPTKLVKSETAGTAVEPTVVTIDELEAADYSEYVSLKQVKYDGTNFVDYRDPSKKIIVYDKYKLGTTLELKAGEVYTVTGFYTTYNGINQIIPLTAENLYKVAIPTVTPAFGTIEVGTVLTFTCDTEGALITGSIGRTEKFDNAQSPYTYTVKETGELDIYAGALKQGYEFSGSLFGTYTVVAAKVAPLTITPAFGSIEVGTEVTISCATEGAVLNGYINGEEVKDTALPYTFTAEKGGQLEVYVSATKDGYSESETLDGTFTVKDEVTYTKASGPKTGNFAVLATTAGKAVGRNADLDPVDVTVVDDAITLSKGQTEIDEFEIKLKTVDGVAVAYNLCGGLESDHSRRYLTYDATGVTTVTTADDNADIKFHSAEAGILVMFNDGEYLMFNGTKFVKGAYSEVSTQAEGEETLTPVILFLSSSNISTGVDLVELYENAEAQYFNLNGVQVKAEVQQSAIAYIS